VRLSLFLGGETRDFKPTLSDVESILTEVDRASQRLGGDYLVTTSRRTPEGINRFLRSQLANHPRCQLCVIASEDSRPEVVPGMMALADYLVVTEDSLSMISEAVSSGKPVVVAKLNRDGLPEKHYRFHEMLEKELGVPVVEAKRLEEVLSQRKTNGSWVLLADERKRIREKLESLL
jgi:mitochondrial fission protein ELM1